jgi:hypothetical protein
MSESLFDKGCSHLTIKEPRKYKDLFDFDKPMADKTRIYILGKFFNEFIIPVTEKVLSKEGIRDLNKMGMVHLLPTVKAIY